MALLLLRSHVSIRNFQASGKVSVAESPHANEERRQVCVSFRGTPGSLPRQIHPPLSHFLSPCTIRHTLPPGVSHRAPLFKPGTRTLQSLPPAVVGPLPGSIHKMSKTTRILMWSSPSFWYVSIAFDRFLGWSPLMSFGGAKKQKTEQQLRLHCAPHNMTSLEENLSSMCPLNVFRAGFAGFGFGGGLAAGFPPQGGAAAAGVGAAARDTTTAPPGSLALANLYDVVEALVGVLGGGAAPVGCTLDQCFDEAAQRLQLARAQLEACNPAAWPPRNPSLRAQLEAWMGQTAGAAAVNFDPDAPLVSGLCGPGLKVPLNVYVFEDVCLLADELNLDELRCIELMAQSSVPRWQELIEHRLELNAGAVIAYGRYCAPLLHQYFSSLL